MREWCADNGIRKTNSIPEDSKANGSAEAAVGLIKKQTRSILSESGLKEVMWPFGVSYAAKQRERKALGEPPLLKLGTKVVVKKRVSNDRRIKGFEPIGLLAKYLGPIQDTTEGHYVLLDDEKGERVMKTARIVPYNEKENDEEDKDLKELGWSWTTDPDGKMFYFNKENGEKSWTTPLRVEEILEEPKETIDQDEEPG